jgi:hypothetical protein
MLDSNGTDSRSPIERFETTITGHDQALADESAGPRPFPSQKYEVIYADPPWHYYGDPKKDQAAGKHYDLMSTADIASLPVRSITAPSAALFLWATGPRLPEAIEVMKARPSSTPSASPTNHVVQFGVSKLVDWQGTAVGS